MDISVDVAVVGGTPSGIACAVRCAKEGLRVALIHHSSHLGGIMSSGLGATDNVYVGCRAPIYDRFVELVQRHYATTYGADSEQVRACFSKGKLHFEPHVAEKIFTEMVAAEPNISLLLRYAPAAVEKRKRKLLAVTFRGCGGEVMVRIKANTFVDASYEGDLAAAAGVDMRTGREGFSAYSEPHAGKIFTYSGQIKPDPMATAGLTRASSGAGQHRFVDASTMGDAAFQAYNFRVCLTCDPNNREYPEKPAAYNRSLYLGLTQRPDEHDDDTFPLRSHLLLSDGSWCLTPHIPNDKLTWNDPLLLGAQMEYPASDWTCREEITRRHADFALGLLYFLQHDDAVRPDVRQEALRWGLPKDEFPDNGHFPYELLVREGRRLAGRYVFTEHDSRMAPGLGRAPIHADSIGIADWPLSSHDCTADRRPGSCNDGVFNLSELSKPAQIPFRALLPLESDNLLVTVCVSCSHVGWGTLRVEPVFMQMGEAAGFAASLAAKQGVQPGLIDPDSLVLFLVERGMMLCLFWDLEQVEKQEWIPAIQYFGTKGFFDSYKARPSELLDHDTAKVWTNAFLRLSTSGYDPMETARQISMVQASVAGQKTVSGEQLLVFLQRGERFNNPFFLHQESITRGEACLALFHALQHHQE